MSFYLTVQVDTISSVMALIIVSVLAFGLSAFCIYMSIRLLKRQIKLYNSIVLVELKSAKLHYFVFISIVSLFIIFICLSLSDASSIEYNTLFATYGMSSTSARVVMVSLMVMLICIDVMLIFLLTSKSAVVDRGIYTALNFLDWYHVHDYIIDEKKGVVLLTSHKNTFTTLAGTTAPLKVSKNDIPKLKFILNKNKNKFSGVSKEV